MQSAEIRRKFLDFFEKRGHTAIPSASLVPEGDNSVLFTTAGMQSLVPYLMGNPHPRGERLVNIQKCVRTQDIDKVGDNTHDTFFEMLGNWSLGDYFKEDAIKWSYELLTSKEEGFGLDPSRLYITIFGGNDDAPKDSESLEIWKKYMPENRIYFLTWNGKKEPNWWDAGDNGPAGPDTEMFYDITPGGLGDMSKEEYIKADEEQKVVEIWNDVFMEYEKKDGRVVSMLSQKNVDTGAGLERLAMVLQKKDNIFGTDLFENTVRKVRELSKIKDIKAERIVSDHLRTSIFLIAENIIPSNTSRGYILRRLIRRAVLYVDKLGIELHSIGEIVDTITNEYRGIYNFVDEDGIREVILEEENKFRQTLERGLKEFNWMAGKIGPGGEIAERELPPSVAFDLVTTHGFPFELVEEVARERGVTVNKIQFQNRMEAHRLRSRTGGEKKFRK